MKHLLTLLTILPLFLTAQNISVASFKSVPDDMTARVIAPVQDNNGEKCALIKMRTTEKGFVFEGDMLGIAKTEQKTGEVWVYVPYGAKKITIKHQQLGVLDSYIYPEAIKEATVYIMELTTGKVTTIVEDYEVPMQWLAIGSTPEGADVYINDQFVGSTPYSIKLENGQHNYRVEKNMYHSNAGVVTLTEEKTETLNLTLKPNFGYAQITSIPESGAIIELDGKAISDLTPYKTNKLLSGSHRLTVKKPMFAPKTLDFVVNDGQTTTVNVTLEPNFGTVNISTNPTADIYIDDEKKGNGTYSGRLMPGLHSFEAKKEKHTSYKTQVEINAGEQKDLSLHPTPQTGNADVASSPFGATIKINGEQKGTTPTTLKNLLIGTYTLTLEKQGYGTVTKTLTITQNQNVSINETLPSGMPITISSNPAGASLTIDGVSAGSTPYNATLAFGSHTIKLVNGKKVVEESISVSQNGKTKWQFNVAEVEGIIANGMLVDTRDNKKYQIIKIGNQTWMAENLNYDAGSNCWCYDDNSSNCTKYGRLYTYETAKNVCPSGWHLPSKAEFETLLNIYGGEGKAAYRALKEGGKSGFNALSGGYRGSSGKFEDMGFRGYFWSSSQVSGDYAWYMSINTYDKRANMYSYLRSLDFSVHCIQD